MPTATSSASRAKENNAALSSAPALESKLQGRGQPNAGQKQMRAVFDLLAAADTVQPLSLLDALDEKLAHHFSRAMPAKGMRHQTSLGAIALKACFFICDLPASSIRNVLLPWKAASSQVHSGHRPVMPESRF